MRTHTYKPLIHKATLCNVRERLDLAIREFERASLKTTRDAVDSVIDDLMDVHEALLNLTMGVR